MSTPNGTDTGIRKDIKAAIITVSCGKEKYNCNEWEDTHSQQKNRNSKEASKKF